MNTYTTKLADIKREWWLVDAKDKVLGRLSTKIAQRLMGKHKTYFNAHLDCGDYVVVTNIDRIMVTGRKEKQKKYFRHSGYPGGFRETSFGEQMEKDPKKILMHAVKGMLPKNKLGADMLKRLKVFVGQEHIYQDKSPKEMSL